ncbi:hypothetical protein L218DRAFT_1009814 [Marasmius fiardii PR-910]|nr:hypothetical protein L218DRAFT_1009814 [Marasmius fiardii PR-910]
MFNDSSHITILRGNINVIQGNQYNTYYGRLTSDIQTQFPPEDEWKKELYREYDRLRKEESTFCEQSVRSLWRDVNMKSVDLGGEKRRAEPALKGH